MARIALAHDYATEWGGAERVALVMAAAFPEAPLYTTLYHPEGTFPEFADVTIRPSRLNRSGLLRRNHRIALPLLAPAVSSERIDADVLLASSSGWAHGYRGARRTVVYCYTPARWLYFRDRYLSSRPTTIQVGLVTVSPTGRCGFSALPCAGGTDGPPAGRTSTSRVRP